MEKHQSVKVNTGLRTESKIQITDGLKFGDTLITTGILQLRQNLPIVLDTLDIKQITGKIKYESIISEYQQAGLSNSFCYCNSAVWSSRMSLF